MKLKLPKSQSKNRSKRKPAKVEVVPYVPTENPLGTLEEIQDRKHLSKVREKYRKEGVLDNYCELLETQIHSLVDKLLPLHEEHIDLKKKYAKLTAMFNEKAYNDAEDMGQVRKQRDKLRVHLNNAVNELSQAQQFARDHIDK